MKDEALKLALEALEEHDYGVAQIIIKEALAQPAQEPECIKAQTGALVNRAFLERVLSAMEGVIDVADRNTDEFDALRDCIFELTLALHKKPGSAALNTAEKLEHVTDGSSCWCDPELDYKDPDTGAEVWIHRGTQ
jgi:hypothetical protein